ncbi:MAG: hypothetical protein JWL94_811 [Microbacteriaceae bacterium]|jgi:hypothetical protein|nr:hypothetical protein [Microbacteriaceae bacterium]HEV7956263.1 hypothetical protein [Marisediminicola sp.]
MLEPLHPTDAQEDFAGAHALIPRMIRPRPTGVVSRAVPFSAEEIAAMRLDDEDYLYL